MPLDTKYYGTLRRIKDSVMRPDDFVVFRAKDNAFAAILPQYRAACEAAGSPQDQLLEVDKLIERVKAWRAEHPDECKAPD